MAYIYDLSDTWNAVGTTFFGIKMNVTNSASASGSKLLSLQVASTEYFGVDKNGNVTIGNGGDLRISSATGGDDSIIYNDAEDLYFSTNGSNRMLINSSGNIGVGNTSPGAKLDVTGNIRLSAASPNIELNNGGPMVYSTASNTLMFATGGGPSSPVERMRINSSGNVGIGTSSPSSYGKLTVSGNIVFGAPGGRNTAFTNNIGIWTTGDPADDTRANIGFTTVAGAASSSSYITFNTNNYGVSGGERMRIDSSGNVGIGTSSPVDKLSVSDGTATFQFKPLGGSSIGYMGMRTNHALGFTTNDTERVRIDSSGNLLVGTSSTFDNVSYLKFQSLGGVSTKIAGTSPTSQMSFFNDNGRVGWIGTDGTITSYNITSDERLKENIANADDASSLIDAIQVRKFDWKADGSHQRYGFIAQELIEVAPEAVSAPPEEDQMMAVDYSKLVPMLVKELQSLRARVAQLEGN